MVLAFYIVSRKLLHLLAASAVSRPAKRQGDSNVVAGTMYFNSGGVPADPELDI